MNENILFAFGLSLFAGLSTGIGGLIAIYTRTTQKTLLSVGLGFSGGVMIYVSMTELMQEAHRTIAEAHSAKFTDWAVLISFFAGMFIIALIDKFVPENINPHEAHNLEEAYDAEKFASKKLARTGLITALAISIHNFPEGLATFVSALHNPEVGLTIAIAIAIHNIPEGIAVAVPLMIAFKSKKKAFMYALMSGLAEPLGAIVGYGLLYPYLTPLVFGVVLAAVAGIMVFISIDELLPAAREYGKPHQALYGVISGMAVMAISLVLLK